MSLSKSGASASNLLDGFPARCLGTAPTISCSISAAGTRLSLAKAAGADADPGTAQPFQIDVRFPAANAGNVRSNLAELMSLAPDVLVSNTNLVTAIAQAEVRTIPYPLFSRLLASRYYRALSAMIRGPTAISPGLPIGIRQQ